MADEAVLRIKLEGDKTAPQRPPSAPAPPPQPLPVPPAPLPRPQSTSAPPARTADDEDYVAKFEGGAWNVFKRDRREGRGSMLEGTFHNPKNEADARAIAASLNAGGGVPKAEVPADASTELAPEPTPTVDPHAERRKLNEERARRQVERAAAAAKVPPATVEPPAEEVVVPVKDALGTMVSVLDDLSRELEERAEVEADVSDEFVERMGRMIDALDEWGAVVSAKAEVKPTPPEPQYPDPDAVSAIYDERQRIKNDIAEEKRKQELARAQVKPTEDQPTAPPGHRDWVQDLIDGIAGANRHVLLEGETGSGKSTLARKVVLGRIEKGEETNVLDPHHPEMWKGASQVFARDAAADFGKLMIDTLREREAVFTEAHERGEEVDFKPVTFALSDAAAIIKKFPEIKDQLNQVMTEGRKLGMSVVLETAAFNQQGIGAGVEALGKNFKQKVEAFAPGPGQPDRTAKIGKETFKTPELARYDPESKTGEFYDPSIVNYKGAESIRLEKEEEDKKREEEEKKRQAEEAKKAAEEKKKQDAEEKQWRQEQMDNFEKQVELAKKEQLARESETALAKATEEEMAQKALPKIVDEFSDVARDPKHPDRLSGGDVAQERQRLKDEAKARGSGKQQADEDYADKQEEADQRREDQRRERAERRRKNVGAVADIGMAAGGPVGGAVGTGANLFMGAANALNVFQDRTSGAADKLMALSPVVDTVTGVFSGLMDDIGRTANRLGEYSPAIAQAQAQAEINATLNDMRRAQQHGNELAEFIKTQAEVQQNFEEIKMQILSKVLPIVNGILKVLSFILGGISEANDRAREPNDPTSIILADGPTAPGL